ncbi:hypothetical protein J9303_01765 [Bacillaceae bacterium Marseille-Q3522]|nr:hypothetical protein [Bacillaceae bacterium Marseille-Q3522]
MAMEQLSKTYRFFRSTDLRNKADVFQIQLEEMFFISYNMLQMIEKELAASSGEVIEESLQQLRNNYEDEQAMINDQILTMNRLAERYDSDVNEMAVQNITIYYEKMTK